ncbi:GNAT family N-acetyltransferase [Micromonospora sp. C51]|uniref:GNAT family N-acetyltransferase n=1 Tax=Micromonospora sp. C51 TaxID=2824879 RepID=UPI001B3701B8|nr:GNAT family N-acetyltransferase [Micromonospora sp. C51]MBQ1049747.1 GNAT family N-acetyltransferase [Micromonospora sp. C51]
MTRVRLFRQDDASAVAELIERCLREVNSRDYPAELIERMCAHFTAERLAQLAMERQVFVAEWDEVVGTVSRDGNKVFTMFVHPGAIGRGVGRRLIGHVEELAAADGFDHIETGASITGHSFYHRLGYVDVRTSDTEFGLNYILRKPLPRQGGPAESERSRRPLPPRVDKGDGLAPVVQPP